MNWTMTIAYYGPAFSGFAFQPTAPKPTVAGCLFVALSRLMKRKPHLHVAGRTDAGVSAVGQVVRFSTREFLSPTDLSAVIALASPCPGALRLVEARVEPV